MEIHAPDSTFEGKSRYGDLELEFEAGVAQHDGDLPDAVRSYMLGAGYGIDEAAPKSEPAPEPVDHPRESRVGTPLADASTQPDEAPDADPAELKGAALDEALEAAGLPKSGTADEKRARLAEHLAAEQAPDAPEAQDN